MFRFMAILLLILAFTASGTGQDEPVVQPKTPQKKDDKLPTDVPVVPKKDTKKDGPPVVADSGEQAILPINFVRNRVENIKSGGEVYVSIDAIRCDAKKRVWLNPYALTGAKGSDRPIIVKRDSIGYHLVFEGVDHQWEAVELDSRVNWIPVRTVVVR